MYKLFAAQQIFQRISISQAHVILRLFAYLQLTAVKSLRTNHRV